MDCMDDQDSDATQYQTVYDSNLKKLAITCKVCDTNCDTMDQFRKHQAGKSHSKKLEKFRFKEALDAQQPLQQQQQMCPQMGNFVSSVSSNNQFWCQVCNVHCNTESQLSVHFSGKLHQKKVGVSKNVSASTKEVPSEQNIASQPEALFQQPTSQTVLSPQPCPMPELTGGFFKCTLCDSISNTLDQYKLHCSGQKHQKKLKSTGMLFSNSKVPLLSPSDSNSSINGINSNVSSVTIEDMSIFQIQSNSSVLIAGNKEDGNVEDGCTEDENQSQLSRTNSSSLLSSSMTLDTRNLSDKVLSMIQPLVLGECVKCQLCDCVSNTRDQYRKHCNGARHKRKLRSFGIESDMELRCQQNVWLDDDLIDDASRCSSAAVSTTEDMMMCEICDISIHRNNMESHLRGRSHKDKLVKQGCSVAVPRPRSVHKTDLEPAMDLIQQLQFQPRKYQIEIYEKAIQKDCVVFLPTGTGKTFIACLILLKMLKENPYHRVVFLVDKVLLVMQQHAFLLEQYENITLDRFDDKDGLTNRKLKTVGLANDFVNTDHMCSVRDHDLIVATAELFRGLLTSKKMFWSDLSICVLDEAHHCVKQHPYNRLLRDYHLFPSSIRSGSGSSSSSGSSSGGTVRTPADFLSTTSSTPVQPVVDEVLLAEWKLQRCKILGLTASPAGETELEATYLLLKELLQAMGDVDIIGVEENIEELNKFTSTTSIEHIKVSYHEQEVSFREFLSNTVTLLLKKFQRFIESNTSIMKILDSRKVLSVEDIFLLKGQLVNSCMNQTDSIRVIFNHIMSLFEIIDHLDIVGCKSAAIQLHELISNKNELVWYENNSLLFAENSRKILSIDTFDKPLDHNKLQSSFLEAIVNETEKLSENEPESGVVNCRKILLLVKERKMVHILKPLLRDRCPRYTVISVVGHGTSSSTTVTCNVAANSALGSQGHCKKEKVKGMSVLHQKRALDHMKTKENQLIIATSVAEEGIDLPECDLVVLANPPNSVQALVQVRGRARKKTSRLLMLCRDDNCIQEMKELQHREKNIGNSIKRIMAEKGCSSSPSTSAVSTTVTQ